MKGKSKYGWLPAFGLAFLVLIASLGFGIYVDGYGLHPPAQYTGVCPAPATISKDGCTVVVAVQETRAGVITTITRTEHVGTILYNGTTRGK